MNKERILSHPILPESLNPEAFSPETLWQWLVRPRLPVLSSTDALTTVFIDAMLRGNPVSFVYVGGKTPGINRNVSVSLVFQHDPAGRIYISGYCQERSSNRIFALDLIMRIEDWSGRGS